MRVQAYSSNQYRANNAAQNNNPSFGTLNAQKAGRFFNWLGDQCNIQSNGSLTRGMFFAVATLFMLGGRFFESRDNDEKREVVTRDVPAVALSVAGAPILNKAMAYAVTKKTGVPIITKGDADKPLIAFGKDKATGEYKYKFGKQGNILSSSFTSQKQLIDWYSDLGDNPLVNFSETVNKHGGNLEKVFKKLGFTDKLRAITGATDNNGILDAIKDAQVNKTEAFQKLEDAMKTLTKDNALVKFARKSQAYVKLAGIGFMAALLGYFLPRLNIITTRNKYQKKMEEGKIDQATFEKKMMRTSPVFRVSSGVLSFHKSSAQKTFKNLLNMVEHTGTQN